MNSKTIIFIVLAVLLATGIGLLLLRQKQTTKSQNKQSTYDVSNAVFDLKLKNYNDEIVSLSDFKGKPLIINSWAAWCPFCRKELPDFATIQKEFKDKITIIAVNRAEAKETAKKYSDELGVTDNLIFLLDPSDSFYQSIGGFSMPETIFINKNGDITVHKIGPMDIDEMRKKVNGIL